MAVFYRKYRPKKISQLDLKKVRESLLADLKKGRLPHAYLFVGPRGSGKTSAARILAKTLNCEENDGAKGELSEPCLKCDQCENIESGKAVDVIEIDAASHRGIDAIRDLRDKIGLAPVMGRKKAYIIDEVHMLTNPAFNALLKTLEEPPEHAQFFLCTTEEQKVPETIASRCVRVGFTKADSEEIKKSLEKVIRGEELKMDKEALEFLAQSVDGSFREGHKLLEQLSGKGKIEVKEVSEVLGVGQGVEVRKLARLLLKGEVEKALEELDKVGGKGVVWGQYGLAVLEYLRGQLKAKYGIGKSEVSESKERVKEVTERMAQACVEMKSSVVEVLPLEIAIVDLKKDVGGSRKKKGGNGVSKKKAVKKEKTKVKSKASVQAKNGKFGGICLADIKDKWDELIESLAPDNHSVAGLLRSCEPKEIEDNFLVIEAYYRFHKEQLEQDERRMMVEAQVDELMGLPAVKFKLGERAQEVKSSGGEDEGNDDDEGLVEAAEELFGG